MHEPHSSVWLHSALPPPFPLDPNRELPVCLDNLPLPVHPPVPSAQISVHIADVTHFVQRDSALDSEARARATSAYFVRGVLPMLPEELSTDLCSLNAGVDRLAFSVECEVDRDGKVLKSWIGRTVMRSAFKMDYNTAQKIIEATEGGTDAPPPPGGLETIFGGHKWEELCQDVADLHSLAQRRRAARKADGAVIMESADLYFDFDDRGHPTGCACARSSAALALAASTLYAPSSLSLLLCSSWIGFVPSLPRSCALSLSALCLSLVATDTDFARCVIPHPSPPSQREDVAPGGGEPAG